MSINHHGTTQSHVVVLIWMNTKKTFEEDIELCVQNIDFDLNPMLNIMGWGSVLPLKEKKEKKIFTLTSYNFYISTTMVELRTKPCQWFANAKRMRPSPITSNGHNCTGSWKWLTLIRASPPLASNGFGPRHPCRCFSGHCLPTPGPRPPDLGRFRASSSFLPPFPPQQAKVRKKHAHLQIPRRHVWKRNTR